MNEAAWLVLLERIATALERSATADEEQVRHVVDVMWPVRCAAEMAVIRADEMERRKEAKP